MLLEYIWPLLMFSCSFIILIIYSIKKTDNFIDVRTIFKKHVEIFDNNPWQIFIFFVVPMMLASGTTRVRIIDTDIISNINIVVSILISMFFAMVSILCSISTNASNGIPPNKQGDNRRKELLDETINTILFCCLLSVFLLIVSFVVLFIGNYTSGWALCGLSVAVYYILFVILFNIFIIIKRLSKLLRNKQSH